MMNLKAVIPVAGLGMHMLPATKAIPKEMLPIVDKPMIQYIVDEIVAAGIKEIVLVTHASKNAVENHFDTSYELESLLEQRVKRQLLAEVQSICPPGVTIMNVRQAQPLGLGHSILCARPVVGDNPFIVVLVINDQYGAPTGAELLADCTAHAIRVALKKPEVAGLYHLVAGGTTTWHDYAALVFDEARKAGITLALTELNAVPTSAYPTPASRPGNSRLNTEKFQRNFDLILPQWELGVKRMLTEMFTTTTI